ncbi:MAG: bifunctional 5,10-methylenetetrahydrofolate dehydrogenase/5,10-methenyltetrahydrofolate cyclohydrolase [Candidatus Krumholzibacteriota bacterium]|nr:bifunctional 5,10-methylenetetrahydrofolate dehydrogenase/5,10-methenyltetrahydrofolate cyclohydrolase [Candidatus Krumholzibacteriota bacterium]
MHSGKGNIIDGKNAANMIIDDLAGEIEIFSKSFRAPRLSVLMVGDDPASRVYVRSKVKASKKCGIETDVVSFQSDIKEKDLINNLVKINEDDSIDGILIQLPLPEHIDSKKVIQNISPQKDVDGFHPYNLGKIMEGDPLFVPCTPLGIIELIKRYNVDTEGKHAVILGRSLIVGKPIAMLLADKSNNGNATVTICHSRTSNIKEILLTADIIVCAVGKAEMVTGDMVKRGVTAIDVGINRVKDETKKKGYRLTGDIDFKSVSPMASLITPVPGGVGPMTVAMLMRNTFKAAKLNYNSPRI